MANNSLGPTSLLDIASVYHVLNVLILCLLHLLFIIVVCNVYCAILSYYLDCSIGKGVYYLQATLLLDMSKPIMPCSYIVDCCDGDS